jgi:hypothetical protein
MPDEPGAGAHAFTGQLRGLTGDPGIPLMAIGQWLEELGRRYQQQRFSLRPVLVLRAVLALDTGEQAAASAHMAAAMALPWDPTAGCPACESDTWGRWRAAVGDDWGALGYWAPVLDGQQQCGQQPHRALARALLPLTRAGLLDQAGAAHERGYPLVRGDASQQAAVGQHVEFCALTGNETRGLAIVAEHAAWLDGPEAAGPAGPAGSGPDAAAWLEFAAGVCVLLRRLTDLGQGALALGPGTVAGRLAVVEQDVQFLCDRFDVRNGTSACRDRVTGRLAQAPLASELALGDLPGPPAPDVTLSVPGPSLDDLVARARQLRDERHPHTRQAWEQVAASGRDLPASVAAELDRQRAGALAETDPRAGRAALLAAAGQFAGLGDQARAWEARATAALAQAQAGDPAGAATALAAAIADAGTAFGAGTLGPRQYLIVRRAGPLMAMQTVAAARAATAAESPDQGGLDWVAVDRAALDRAAELTAAELAEAERLGVPQYAANHHDLLAQLAAWRGDPDRARAHLEDARQLYLGIDEPWNAARAEGQLAQFALAAGDRLAAEQTAREALIHGGGLLSPGQGAGLRLLLANAIGPDRPGEAAGQFRLAAELYAELGDVTRRVRCLRSAAWLDFNHAEAGTGGDGVVAMAAVLAELNQLAELAPEDAPGYLAAELAATRSQLADMRAQRDASVLARVTAP